MTMKRISRFSLLMTVVGSLAACGTPINPDLVAPPENLGSADQQAPVDLQFEYKPKVDVLFVIDNSDSMKTHQNNLKANINRFVEAFDKYDSLDFQIGAVSIFDSKRFGPVVKDFYPLGQLRPLRDPQYPDQPVEGQPYVTRAPRYAEILGESLKIGTQARGTDKNDLGGPEYEEAFSPVVAAVDETLNPGFSRKDAHLAVIMITDANDDSAMTPAQLHSFLVNLKGPNGFSTYAALALDKCKTDPSGPPTKILEFIQMTRGKAFNLCDPKYGDRLAEAGRLIQEKASRVQIDLALIPEYGTLSVGYGGQKLEQDPKTGWTYDPSTNSVVINSGADLKGGPDAKLNIEYIPVDPRRMGTERAIPIGL